MGRIFLQNTLLRTDRQNLSAHFQIHYGGDRLTSREREIADQVAQGQINAETSAALWITENSVGAVLIAA